jgi:hypothetical protein
MGAGITLHYHKLYNSFDINGLPGFYPQDMVAIVQVEVDPVTREPLRQQLNKTTSLAFLPDTGLKYFHL